MKKQSTLIHHFLEQSAKSFPDKIALIHEATRATYAEINSKANHLARWLIDNGITKGDRVVLILENSLEYVTAYYGILKAGAVVAPLSTDLKPDGLQPLLLELEPKVIISSSRFERILQATELNPLNLKALILSKPKLKWPASPFHVFSLEDMTHGEHPPDPDIQVDENGLSSIIYTSGSTGQPKGVMLSHKNIVSNTDSICQYLNLTGNDIQMVVLPFHYVMGKSLLNTHFAAGGTVVLNNKFAFPATVINQMMEEKVTGFSGVPSTYAYLLNRSPLGKYRDKFVALRYCSQAGGHMPRQIKEGLRKTLPPHTKICIMYGATEASARLAYLPPDQFDNKMDSIGRPIPGVTLRVVDKNGQDVPVGEIGELVGNGPNIMQGYWKDDQTLPKVLGRHGYHTGDMAYKDTEGYYYVVGRKDNLLKVGGHRINPQEVEDALMNTNLLIETVVLGIPDDMLGNRLVSLAVPQKNECTYNRILSHCAKLLPKYKLPGEVRIVRALPKNTSGKINRARCLELLKQK